MLDGSWGNGKQIKVMGHPWLNDILNPFISGEVQRLDNALVTSLMTMDGQQWDMEIIDDFFNQRDRQCILSVPVGGRRD